MHMNKKSKTFLNNKNKKKWLIVSAVLIALYFVSLFVPLIAPFTRYPLYIVKCGGLPIVASNFAAGNTYRVPGDEGYGVKVFDNHMFCTESEAKSAGFRNAADPVRYNP